MPPVRGNHGRRCGCPPLPRAPIAASFLRSMTASFPPIAPDARVVIYPDAGHAAHLQQPMQARRRLEVLSAHHVRDALDGIIDDDREMIARRGLLAD